MQESKPLLSICIPTFNRPDKIRQQLVHLSNLKDINKIEVIIIDNCSDILVSDIYQSIDLQIPNITIIRNELNIGGNANILRCIEIAKTPWIWLLGDDDCPNVDALDIIFQDITQVENQNVALIKYSSELGQIEQNKRFSDFDTFFSFITTNDLFSNLLFMSSCVINSKNYKKYYVEALQMSFNNFSQLVPLFYLLSYREASVLFSSEKICQWEIPDQKKHWFFGTVYLDILRGINLLPFFDERKRKIVIKKWLKIRFKSICHISIIMKLGNTKKEIIYFVFMEYCKIYFSSQYIFYFCFLYPISKFLLSSLCVKMYNIYKTFISKKSSYYP